jgi:molybdenum cofactor guanylyltransferase
MKVAAVIIAGGRSRRMGEEKALLRIGGTVLLTRIIDRLSPQVTAVALNVNGDVARYSSFRLPIIPDVRTAVHTPLAGLHAALQWTSDRGFDAAVTVPSDCPFLPHDMVRRLQGVHGLAAVAASGGEMHHLTGLWPRSLLGILESAIDRDGLFRVKDWATRAGATPVTWADQPYDPFLNVNTPEDLALANAIAAEFDP